MSGYTGFEPTSTWKLDRVSPDIDPHTFWKRFVRARKPCIVEGPPSDAAWAGTRWTDAYLKKKAGTAEVQVEVRDDAADSFGKDRKVPMQFGTFVSHLQKGSGIHYLTTQPVPEDEDGTTQLCASPVRELMGDFPTRPALLGHLVPWQYNMWMGNNKAGSSSGLHHDFHDNLYVLLRGHKRFRLACPASVHYLDMAGKVRQVHANGLINYKGCVTRQDGAHPDSVREARARRRLAEVETELREAEEALTHLSQKGSVSASALQTARDRSANAERALDAVLGAALVTKAGDVEVEGVRVNAEASEDGEGENTRNGLPVNFSKIALSMDSQGDPVLAPNTAQLENFGNVVFTECQVNSGEMLYLPAGWFHEVTSYTDTADTAATGKVRTKKAKKKKGKKSKKAAGTGKAAAGHVAFNFWVHPPSSDAYEHPYVDSHWDALFKHRYGEGTSDKNSDNGQGNGKGGKDLTAGEGTSNGKAQRQGNDLGSRTTNEQTRNTETKNDDDNGRKDDDSDSDSDTDSGWGKAIGRLGRGKRGTKTAAQQQRGRARARGPIDDDENPNFEDDGDDDENRDKSERWGVERGILSPFKREGKGHQPKSKRRK